MRRALVEPGERRPRRFGHMAHAVIFAHERLDRLDAVEPHQGLELDFIAKLALHQVDVAEARDVPSLDARDDVAADDLLISLGILRRGPPAPLPADHTRIGMRT